MTDQSAIREAVTRKEKWIGMSGQGVKSVELHVSLAFELNVLLVLLSSLFSTILKYKNAKKGKKDLTFSLKCGIIYVG